MKPVLLNDAIDLYLQDLIERKEAPETTLKSKRNTLWSFVYFAIQMCTIMQRKVQNFAS